MSTAAPVSTHTRCHTAFFTALRDGESTLIAATGELDAANSADFVAHATAYARRGQCLSPSGPGHAGRARPVRPGDHGNTPYR